MVSMKDISLKCGVSIATVSKALNDHSDIGAETKIKIQRVAREMGYLPNSSARALKTNRTHNLGVLFVDAARSGLKHDYFANVLDSFKVTAEENGYDITFINCNKEHQTMTYLEHGRYRGVDGVVIACVDFEDPQVIELVRSEIPVVTIDHSFEMKTSVVSDNVEGMRELTDYVCDMGHTRIAYIHGDDTSVTRNRLASFNHTLEVRGIAPDYDLQKAGKYRDTKESYKYTNELLELKDPPTCILYSDDYSLIGGLNAIKEKGLSVPEDISVAGYDGLGIAMVLKPAVTSFKQDTEKLGSVAAQKLITSIERPKSSIVERILIEGKLIKGETVKKIK
ncbi:MAG: LacI family transcriptional regulator [Lachnospiraceae bacterium]|nr:LacI family transcriptional regulator [Lachnospiraceae bacterium]